MSGKSGNVITSDEMQAGPEKSLQPTLDELLTRLDTSSLGSVSVVRLLNEAADVLLAIDRKQNGKLSYSYLTQGQLDDRYRKEYAWCPQILDESF